MSRRTVPARAFVAAPMLDHNAIQPSKTERRRIFVSDVPAEFTRRIPTLSMSVVLALAMLTTVLAVLSFPAPQVSAYTTHAPIVIAGDVGFTPANGVTGGDGSEGNPFVISGWEIVSNSTEGVYIHDTTAYFVVRGLYVHGNGMATGIHLAYLSQGIVTNCTLNTNFVGIRLDGVSDVVINDNAIDDNYDSGVMLYYSTFVEITNNSIDRDAYAIYADYGVHDISILNNSMDESEYGGLMAWGTALRITAVNNTMRSSQSGYGITFSTTATTNFIADNNLSENDAGGIAMNDASTSNIIRNNTVLDSLGGYGIYVAIGDLNVIENNTVARASDDGIYMGPQGSSGQNRISNNTVEECYIGINSDSGPQNIITDNVVSGNTGGGISLLGSGCTVSGNNIADNLEFGLYIGPTSPSNTITGNTFVNDGLFGQFIGSDYNDISSNTVNSKPLVFLEKVNGYSVPSAGQVVAKDCSDITISGLNLSAASVGVELWNSVNCHIQGTTLKGNNFGIYMDNHSSNNVVSTCDISSNSYGVYIFGQSNSNSVQQSTLNDNTNVGLVVGFSANNELISSTLDANVGAVSLTSCSGTLIQGNSVNGAAYGIVIYYSSSVIVSQNNLVDAGAYGISLFSSSQCTLETNQINTDGFGVSLAWDSNGNLIWNNTIYQNEEGIYLTSSDAGHTCNWNNITGNWVADSTIDGIWLSYGHMNTISWNNVTGGGFGINVNGSSASSNWIYLNNFTGNSVNAFSDNPVGTNWWNTTVQVYYVYSGSTYYGFLGNRYGDYSGPDPEGDGVGNTPYAVGGEQDSYPLIDMPTAIVPEFPGMLLPIVALTMLLCIAASKSARRKKQ